MGGLLHPPEQVPPQQSLGRELLDGSPAITGGLSLHTGAPQGVS